MNIKRAIAMGVGGMMGTTAGLLCARFYLGRYRAEHTGALYPKMRDMGTVEELTILPLIDWYTADDHLANEAGVSYLIRADETTILFDMGFNRQVEHPSPLLRNMATLGVERGDVDALFFSHAHPDHLGGMSHVRNHTFAPSGQPVDLKGIPAYVPELLTNPTARTIVVDKPRLIAPGVVSMGPIPRQLFFYGWTPEQSLAVNVAGKGIVLIIGCGHPTIQRIVERAEMLFDEPLYGVVGGLHYPVTRSRSVKFGLQAQMFLGTGKLPWDPINQQDVKEAITYLQRRNPQLVALSPHDSCDWSLSAFKEAFGEAYQELLVGNPIVVSK